MKRGVSPVIATVLLLVMTVILISILATFTIPFVKNSLEPKSDCFKTLDKLTVSSTEYSCYTVIGSGGRTGFSVQRSDIDIVGFKAIVYAQGSSQPIDILPGSTSAEVRMLDGQFNQPLELPAQGGLKTYVIMGGYDQVEVAPILSSGSCDKTGTLKLKPCSTTTINASLTSP